MKAIILEDEMHAVNHLKRLITEVAPDIEVSAVFDTAREAALHLAREPMPDLIFSDVQLADGISFDAFSQVKITCPIIFTTAYDSYAIDAFNANGIDYLLKPIEQARLLLAIQKARKMSRVDNVEKLLNLAGLGQPETGNKPRSRFMIRVGEKIRTIGVEDILIFYSFERGSYLHTREHRNYLVDYSLEELEDLLDKQRFFRISRRYIVSIDACSQIIAWSNHRLKIDLKGVDEDLIVARERVREFKAWLEQ